MEMRSEKLQDLTLEDGKVAIMELLSSADDVSVVVEKHGNTVRFAALRSYDDDTRRILAEAREEHRRRKAEGYSREDAFADIAAVRSELEDR
jgi:hypothetical protein